MDLELGIIGAGNMAEAIARGVIKAGLIAPAAIAAADPSPQRRQLFSEQLGISAGDDNRAVAARARILLLSVKPYQMKDVLADLGSVMSPQTLVVSIAAGVSSRAIESALGGDRPWRVVRTMPNTPMLVGAGMAALARGRYAQPADIDSARRLFESAARVIEVSEDKIDAVTALSGSGPAYFFFLVEQMIQTGIELGLSAQDASTLARQTAAGAARMMLDSPDSPAELRRKVTTPNGTTHAAIAHLESKQWPRITAEAITAAARRSHEMGQ